MENAENGDGAPETAPGAQTGERSKRFLGFGIKRIAIPKTEIKEHLSLNFARQRTRSALSTTPATSMSRAKSARPKRWPAGT